MIPRETIERIKSKLDIVEVISEYVSLQKVGANYRGLCPFHTETTPSFYVSPTKNIYHCFGCGASGDVIKFIQEIENISYVEALRKLAERVGEEIELREEDQLRSLYFEFYRQLHNKYRSALNNSANIIQYLEDRGFDKREISLYEFGYSPPGSKFPQIIAQALNLDKEKLEQFGFVQADPFAGRITIPISDDYGRIIAFGGRLVGDGVPKYINSQDTIVFKKSASLFMMHVAKEYMKQLDYAVICEGYFDAIAFHRAGIKSTVATLGTALTKAHASKIKRITNNIVIAFDSDTAGVKATLRSLELLLPLGFNVMIAQFAGGKDADEVYRKLGEKGLIESLENSKSPDLFVAETLAQGYDFSNPNAVNTYLQSVRRWMTFLQSNPKLVSGLTGKVAELVGLSVSRVESLLSRMPEPSRTNRPYAGSTGISNTHAQTTPSLPTLEDYLVFMYFNYPDEFSKLEFSPEILEGKAREFFLIAKDLNVSLDQLSKDMGNFVRNSLEKINFEVDDSVINGIKKEIEVRKIEKRIKEIDSMISKVSSSDEKKILLKARIELVKQREKLKKAQK